MSLWSAWPSGPTFSALHSGTPALCQELTHAPQQTPCRGCSDLLDLFLSSNEEMERKFRCEALVSAAHGLATRGSAQFSRWRQGGPRLSWSRWASPLRQKGVSRRAVRGELAVRRGQQEFSECEPRARAQHTRHQLDLAGIGRRERTSRVQSQSLLHDTYGDFTLFDLFDGSEDLPIAHVHHHILDYGRAIRTNSKAKRNTTRWNSNNC
jgi:hypothetical protein